MLVNARHSWVGDACLARGGDSASGGAYIETPRPAGVNVAGGSGHYDCMLTPSSMGAAPEQAA